MSSASLARRGPYRGRSSGRWPRLVGCSVPGGVPLPPSRRPAGVPGKRGGTTVGDLPDDGRGGARRCYLLRAVLASPTWPLGRQIASLPDSPGRLVNRLRRRLGFSELRPSGNRILPREPGAASGRPVALRPRLETSLPWSWNARILSYAPDSGKDEPHGCFASGLGRFQ
jgi:hypothetical protein